MTTDAAMVICEAGQTTFCSRSDDKIYSSRIYDMMVGNSYENRMVRTSSPGHFPFQNATVLELPRAMCPSHLCHEGVWDFSFFFFFSLLFSSLGCDCIEANNGCSVILIVPLLLFFDLIYTFA